MFSKNIVKAIEEDNNVKFKQRQRVAQENDWDQKVSKMVNYIDSL